LREVASENDHSQAGMELQQIKNTRGNTFDTNLGLFRLDRKGYVPRHAFFCILQPEVE
jgi:hypothetical protein